MPQPVVEQEQLPPPPQQHSEPVQPQQASKQNSIDTALPQLPLPELPPPELLPPPQLPPPQLPPPELPIFPFQLSAPTPGGKRTIPEERLNRPKSYKSYKSTLRQFMTFTNRIEYPRNYQFSIEELSQITPRRLFSWMAYKVYGKENPDPSDNPIYGTTNSIKC